MRMLPVSRRCRFAVILAALAAPASAVAQTPIVGPPVRIDQGGTSAANETTAAASAFNPNVAIGGWNDWRASGASEVIRSAFSLTFDGGQTWSDVIVRPPAPNQSGVEGDPMTAFDDRTGALWAGAISFTGNGGVYVARLDPGETTFEPTVMARVTGGADKCWMAAGPDYLDPEETIVYIAYNQGLLRSTTMGDTWAGPFPFGGGGIGYLPRIGPAGELYVAYWDFGDGLELKRSFNGGTSFTTHTIATRMDTWGTQDGSRFPGTFRVPPLVYFDVDPNDGALYAVYFDTTNVVLGNSNVDIYFTRSVDQGTTWSTPVVMNNDTFRPGDQFFTWIETDAGGGLHVVAFDSRHVAQNDGTTNGMFDAYYYYSNDHGNTWQEFRLTPDSWNSDDDGLDRPQQFIGDYLGLAVAGRHAYPVYLDMSNGDPDVYTNVIVIPGSPDLDGDGSVGPADLAILLAAWGSDDFDADLNGDGIVDAEDLAALLSAWT
ncbi:MAG: hypothetical protein KDA25_01985 [Phycisphaerales bacterium]|nr:hypothetical protein [Phycisphaerales bacterium]